MTSFSAQGFDPVTSVASPSLVAELIDYDPETGRLFWKPRPVFMFRTFTNWKTWTKQFPGKQAFTTVGSSGYHEGAIFCRTYRAHRVALAITNGEWPVAVDHINGARTDNRLCNLRAVSTHENCLNRRLNSANRSGTTGVSWSAHSQKWQVHIGAKGGKRNVGLFASLEDAVAARREAERKLGYHPNHGRVQ